MARYSPALQARPILASLARHKVATALIVLQVALTLAVVSNAFFIVATRVVHLSRPTGTDESHLFTIRNGWRSDMKPADIDTAMRADLVALRRTPGVREAFASEAQPLGGGGGILVRLRTAPEQTTKPKLGIVYFGDTHAIDTFGLRLVEGRNFHDDEVAAIGPYDKLTSPSIIITRSLADKLFPDGAALGRSVWTADGPAAIIGIVQSLQGPYAGSTTRSIDEDSVLYPARMADPEGTVYIVRTQGGSMGAAIDASLAALSAQGGQRLIDPVDGVKTLARARDISYDTDRSVATMMAVVCALLLLATAGGIVGLSSFWVGQRRRQIGIRRALGASAADILQYFHIENALIVGGGVVLGAVLAIVANIALMGLYEMPALPMGWLAVGAIALWLLGQLAVHGPARSASKVAPVVAIRGDAS
jgi:putative ABC transport system permease protein